MPPSSTSISQGGCRVSTFILLRVMALTHKSKTNVSILYFVGKD